MGAKQSVIASARHFGPWALGAAVLACVAWLLYMAATSLGDAVQKAAKTTADALPSVPTPAEVGEALGGYGATGRDVWGDIAAGDLSSAWDTTVNYWSEP